MRSSLPSSAAATSPVDNPTPRRNGTKACACHSAFSSCCATCTPPPAIEEGGGHTLQSLNRPRRSRRRVLRDRKEQLLDVGGRGGGGRTARGGDRFDRLAFRDQTQHLLVGRAQSFGRHRT